ncbi:DUF2523 family protein [Chitiniphilus eburneus]|uniref:DUF2523 family protein n=1 Tax=Chitiniphilus eburneus TaxID=2571148 RepID=UPI0035CEC2FD
MLDSIFSFFSWIVHAILSFPELITSGIAYLIGKLTVLYWEIKLEFIKMVWGISKSLIQDLNLSGKIRDAMVDLPPAVYQTVLFCRFPEAINIIFSGALTKFILRWMPF